MKNPGLYSTSFALFFILLIAFMTRTKMLTQPLTDAYGWRQSSTAMMARNFYEGEWNIFYPRLDYGGEGPNYQGREFQTVTFLAACVYLITGEQEWVGRAISICFGLLGIFVLYQLVFLVWDEQRALISAAVMAVLPGGVLLERTFVPDPAMVSFGLLALWMLLLFCHTERNRFLVLATIFAILGALTKITCLILGLPAVYAIYIMLFKTGKLTRKMAQNFLIAGLVLFVTVAAYYLWALYLAQTYPPYHFAGQGKFLSLSKLLPWLSDQYFLPELFIILIRFWSPVILGLVLLGLVHPLINLRIKCDNTHARNKPVWFFHFWGAALAIQYIFEAEHLVIDSQNLHFYNPFAAVMAGYAIMLISDSLGRSGVRLELRRFGIVFIIGLMVTWGSTWSSFYYQNFYQNNYQIGRRLKAVSDPDDLVICFSPDPVAIYYSGLKGWVFPPYEELTNFSIRVNDHSSIIDYLEKYRIRGATWLVIPKRRNFLKIDDMLMLKNKYPQLADYFLSKYELVEDLRFGMIFRSKAG